VAALRISSGRICGAELVDRLAGAALQVNAASVVNATGPWVDTLRRMESATAATSVMLSKGAHLLLDAPEGWSAAVTTPLAGGRVSFAIPWEGMLLLGTTDEPFDGDPAELRADDDDQRQILDEAARSLEPQMLAPSRVRSRFAGLRVLPLAGQDTAGTRRETVLSTGPAGMVSVAGGKLTTWRSIGGRAAAMALAGRGGRVPRRPVAVPGAAAPAQVERRIAHAWPQLEPDVRASLARHYGTVALQLLERGRERPALLERIHPHGPDLWAQVPHARDHEWAATAEDVLRGRTTVALRGHADAAVRQRVRALLEEP
jgi:glycerol-3-phosphate dehydrogenase